MNIKMGEVLNLHTNGRGRFGMAEQHRKCADHSSTVLNVHV